MPTTAYGDINQRTAAYAAVEMLSHAEPILVLSKFGQNKPLPKNKADTVKFRRPVPFSPAVTPLTEGVTPSSQQMAYEDVTVQLNQYGAYVEITDKVQDMAEDPVLKDSSMLCGEQAGETIEMITWGILKAGTNVQYANGAARADVNSVIELGDLRAAVRNLKAQRAKAVTMMLSGSPHYATKPIEGGYIAFGHTDLEADIRGLAGFTPVAEYGSRQPLCSEEVGSVENIRIILSPLLEPFADAGGLSATNTTVSTTGTNSDVYPMIVVGKEAYGLVPLKGQNAIKPMVLNPGTPRGGDPLGQRGTVGWKTFFQASRLNETWMVRIECAVTDL